MVEEQIQQLKAAALKRIEEAADRDALEQVRVDVLGRKGSLAQFNLGKLPPEERKIAGQALNAAKQELTSAFETKKQSFDASALNARLKHEWLDLTLPAPRAAARQPASGDDHPE